jgi:cell division protein FtsZ
MAKKKAKKAKAKRPPKKFSKKKPALKRKPKKAVKPKKKLSPKKSKKSSVSKRKKSSSGPKKKPAFSSRDQVHRTRMRIIGIGGGGSSIVSEIAPQISRIDFVVANTDTQALREAARQARKFSFGNNVTGGLGCGMDPRLGQKAVKEESDKVAKLFQGIDLAVIVSSLGGGTGSGAAPEFAKIAREMGVMTVGIFTMPFKFEGGKRAQIAKSALERITPNLNVVSIIPNENIFKIIDKNTPLKAAFSSINGRLSENLRGLIEMIYVPGLINIDFADLKTILEGKGKLAYLNTAVADGPSRAEEAVKDLLKSPLNEYTIQGAEKIVFNITAPQALEMREVEHISRTISDYNKRAKIIFGVSQDNSYKNKLRVTLLAVGVGKEPAKKRTAKKAQPEPEPAPAPEPEPELKKKPAKKKTASKKKPKQNQKPKKKTSPKKPKPKKKSKPAPKPKKKSESKEIKKEEKVQKEENKTLTRKNALDLKKEAEKTEEEIIDQEKRWDIPAFLRKRESE